ncbi:MAG: hypothetical protein KGZ80_04485 [Methylomonas sp.]|nr:hypothetical protein [Methylomonas sp.]PPD22142.1 MAG: hypothetical protein CTY23_03050 [Methylomonas sp.]PPD25252.1 MAG: hypothetical protein CTY22_09340 [Methylomonas sp.]PPD35203.1 MAG: hypothetical protein CTY21_09340 [Methylomonas sp.]PPD42474.1 MAG: hypothetical protein CTY17_01620 [Methylomonas sp.]
MQIKLPIDNNKPVSGEATIEIVQPVNEVFWFVGDQFFINYPKWAVEVNQFEPLDGNSVFIGARAKQVRDDNGSNVESIFEITEFLSEEILIFKGITAPYKHSYLFEVFEQKSPTKLTFRFELLELEVFMRPFAKLIRSAIEEGAENTVENIKSLIETPD